MPCLTLLLPPTRRCAAAALPALLAKRLGRATRFQKESGEAAQLARHVHAVPPPFAPAALSRLAEGSAQMDVADVQAACWLRADPAHIRPDINGARLLGVGQTLGLSQVDVAALLPALRPLFGDLGMTLDAPHPERWYVRVQPDAQLPAFASPDVALGEDVFEHIPDGLQARRWRSLQNEVQIVLHHHPHNAARSAAGQVPINSLWFWGAGRLPQRMQSAYTAMYSDDPVLQGAAACMQTPCYSPTTLAGCPSSSLIDLRMLRDRQHLVEHWLLPASAHEVLFDFADGVQFHLHPRQGLRVWRKPLHCFPI